MRDSLVADPAHAPGIAYSGDAGRRRSFHKESGTDFFVFSLSLRFFARRSLRSLMI